MKKGEILDKVYKSNLPSRGKQIMFYLINRSNAEGTCFPSVRTIAGDCSLSERTIQRTMKVLLEEGFVIRENRYRDNGGQSSNLYKLQIEPEKKIDNQSNSSEENIKEENLELVGEKNDKFESIETVSFHDYIEVKETKENNINNESQTVSNILVQKMAQGDNFTKEPECHPIFFQCKVQIYNNLEEAKSLNFLCRGPGDNLYPP